MLDSANPHQRVLVAEQEDDSITIRNDIIEMTAIEKLRKDIGAANMEDVDQATRLAFEADFPDGGLRAWSVVLGAMCITFSTFGYVNAWGAFQSHYEETLLKDSSPSNIAWIGSIQYSFVFLPSFVIGRLFDLGHLKVPMFCASVLLVVANFLMAECKEYWQFLLCQGFAVGIACGTLFGPTLSVISHWFKKRRGYALGLVAVGSSIGGTVFPIAATKLIQDVGFKWTMRILGFILFVMLSIANISLRRRLPPVNVAGGLIHFGTFKSAAYTTYCISGLFTFLGLYTVLTFIDISAIFVGVSPNFSFYLIAIANASSGLGRLAAGILVDSYGAINIMAPLTLVAGVLTYAWPFARSEAALIVVAILYGFASGAYVSSFATPLIELGGTADVGRRIGMAMTIVSAGALAGPPISGAINSSTHGFKAVGYYAGSMVLVAVGFMLISRHLVLGGFRGKF